MSFLSPIHLAGTFLMLRIIYDQRNIKKGEKIEIKKKHIFGFFGPFFSQFIIFGWDFVEKEKNHQKSVVILPHF